MAEIKQFKVLLVGDPKVGKSTIVKVLMDYLENNKSFSNYSELDNTYNKTNGVKVDVFDFNTNLGLIRFNLWDCAGDFGGLGDGYYIAADAVIFVFDLTVEESYINLKKWLLRIKRVHSNIPYIIVGTHVDKSSLFYINNDNTFKRCFCISPNLIPDYIDIMLEVAKLLLFDPFLKLKK